MVWQCQMVGREGGCAKAVPIGSAVAWVVCSALDGVGVSRGGVGRLKSLA